MNDIPTEPFEHAEHAEHAAHEGKRGNNFIGQVTMTIAALAVLAATVGSLETLESGKAISAKNEAVLFQNKASDQWAFYQAKSLKKNMYDIAAAAPGPKQDDFAAQARRYDGETNEIMKSAKELEHKTDERLEESNHHEHRHHILTGGVTLLHVAIAIATIAIISGRRWPWYGSIALGIGGLVAATAAYLV